MVETNHRERISKRRRLRQLAWITLVVIPAAFVVIYLTRGYSLPAMARLLDVGEVPLKTEYVLPLSGDPDTRPFVTAAIYKAGLASKVLVSRVPLSPQQIDAGWPAPHDTTKKILATCGVPTDKIEVLEMPHRNTYEEAVAVRHFLEGHPNSSLTIVTNGFHTRRARWAFQKVLGPKAANLHFVSAPCDGFDESNWWRVDEGFTNYTTEYMKFAYYIMRYGSLPGWLALALVSFVVATKKTRQPLREKRLLRESAQPHGTPVLGTEIVGAAEVNAL